MATERPSGLKQRSYLIGGDEITWLETAAGKTKLTQSDLVRLALQRLRCGHRLEEWVQVVRVVL